MPPESPVLLLLIDDDSEIRESFALAFEVIGYRLLTASTAEGAFEEILRHTRPCLMMIDAHLPGMSGQAAVAKLRAKHPHIPIIGISAHDCGDAMLEAGADTFFSKPIEMEHLVKFIDEIVGPANEPREYLAPSSMRS